MFSMLPHLQRLNVFLAELRRRRVFRAAAVYSVSAWATIEVASTVLPVFPVGDADALIRFLVILAVLGFPVILVLAWVFDLTSQGVQKTEADQSAPPAVSKFLRSPAFQATLVLSVLLFTGGAWWVSWQVWLRPAAPASEAEGPPGRNLDPTRLAVLYFDDHSQEGNLGYLANGLTEALIHELSQIGALEVISRNGVKPYRNLDFPLDSLARVLRVGSIVEGSVEKEGNRIGVTVQLIEGETEAHLLSQRLEGTGEDVLAIRDSIVEIAVRSLGQTLGRELERRRTQQEASTSRAWELFQRALRLREDADTLRWARADTLAASRLLAQADAFLAEAGALDEDWARPLIARGWLSRTRAGLFSALQSRRAPGFLNQGIQYAEEALDRSPEDPEALELRGTLRANLARVMPGEAADTLTTGALADLNAAVRSDPDRVMAWVTLADLLRVDGRFEEASVAAQRAVEADPFLINGEMEVLFILSQVWLELGEVERADAFIDAGRRRFPGEPSFPAAKLVLLAGGAPGPSVADTALALVRQVENAYGMANWVTGRLQLAAVLASEERADSARALLDGTKTDDDPWLSYYAAKVRLNLGERDAALELLGSFLDSMPSRRAYIAQDWWWAPLRDDPRFRGLVEGAGAT